MTIKEQPLINAMSRLGVLPGFLFSSPILAGFFALLLCGFIGAFCALFQGIGHGAVVALQIFDFCREGAIIGIVIAIFIYAGITITVLFNRDEAKVRLQFVLVGLIALVSLVILDWLFLETVRDWLATSDAIYKRVQ